MIMERCNICKEETPRIIHDVDLLAVMCYACQGEFSDWVDENPGVPYQEFRKIHPLTA